jgi:flagellar hook assembly protein FlgD
MKQHDDSSKGSFKSGGQRIDDHSFWAGKGSKGSVFPDGPHKTKDESSAEGSGSVLKYEDTTEAIKSTQVEGVKKVKSHPMKQPGYRY